MRNKENQEIRAKEKRKWGKSRREKEGNAAPGPKPLR
jgi:hypothetical protein